MRKVSCWAKRVEAQRAQSAIRNNLTNTKEIDKVKIMKGTHKNSLRRPFPHVKCPQNRCVVIAAPAIHQDNAWVMGRSVQTAARLATSGECVEAREPEL